MGENLSLSGLLEGDAYIGDVLVFPGCELAISEPRYPCFKFNAAMGFNKAVKMMSQSGWCGFYLAVRQPGTIEAGQSFTLRPGPREVSVAEIFRSKMKGKA
jgi:MOSC domain-containing protein YiiM